MTGVEKHIEKLLSWYKEAVTEDGVCYLTCDDKNTLAYAIKCCKHFEDIKKDIDSWMLREESSSSEIPTGTPNTISFKEMTDNLKITAEDIENAEDIEYSIDPLIHPKNDLAQERYQDLIEYFSDEKVAKTILESRKQFKAWLERLRWNVKRADELARELDQIKEATKNNLAVDCISRADVNRIICEYRDDAVETGSERDLERAYGANAVGALISELPSVTPQEPKWIPVSERLPEENKTVIASTKYGVYPEARYTKEDGWEWAYESGVDYWVELEYVTAWMPLPESYEPQESEDDNGM